MTGIPEQVAEFLSCQHEFDEQDSDLNGADAECIHCGTLAGDAYPEPT